MQTRRGFSKKRGAGILTVLTASTLLLLLGLTVAGTSFHHLSVSNRLHHSQNARNLAEDCLSRAAAQVLAQPTRYCNPNYSGFTPLPSATAPKDERGILTFDPTELNTLNGTLKNPVLISSLNNLAGTSSAPIGNGSGSIPAHSLYLRAVGVDHGVERAMECVLWVPPFPYSMASGGPISIAGTSNVASVDNLADANDQSKWLPGSLVSNSQDMTKAIDLKDDVTVRGDIQTMGMGQLSGNAVVKGEKRYQAPSVRIPTIRVEDYDTSAKPNVLTYSTANPTSNQVNGFAYRDGALNYTNGIKLNNGVVYVKGDVQITGKVEGKGAIIATGSIKINGSGSIAANNEVAILSKSDVTLDGSSTDHIGTTGLLYSEGKLTANYADIIGSAAAPKNTSSIEFTNVNMVQNRSSSTTTITVGGGPAQLPQNIPFPEVNASIYPVFGAVVRGGVPVLLPPPPISFQINVTNSSRFKETSTGEYHIPVPMDSQDQPADINGNVLPGGVYESIEKPGSPGTYYQVPVTAAVQPIQPSEVTVKVNGVSYQADDPAWQTAAQAATINSWNAVLGANQLTPAEITANISSSASAYQKLLAGPSAGNLPRGMTYTIAKYQATMQQMETFHQYNLALSTAQGPGETITFSLDPGLANGNFVNLADNIRILYWREVPLQ
ncbi:hypothetical protein JST97_21785 [bacterium]|nr:hypothetical protein [bacterium]